MYTAGREGCGFFTASLSSRTVQVDTWPSGTFKEALTWTEPINLWCTLTRALKSDGKEIIPLALHGPKPRVRLGRSSEACTSSGVTEC